MSTSLNPPARSRRSRATLRRLQPVLWVGPATALIAVVVLWPVVVMVKSSLLKISPDGFVLGNAGSDNFKTLFDEPDLGGVIFRTALWVVGVVVITMLISMALAQLFNQRFPGRRVTRWALIVPWACSVIMTSLIFRWALDSSSGVINVILHDLGIIHSLNSAQSDWLGRPGPAFAWMMLVAVFVSLPFSTYAILAGLQSIPVEVYEAASLDGAGGFQRYVHVTLPLVRPAIIVAALINVINVFNSFPIIWEMTRGGPGYSTSTTTTFMFILKQGYIGESAAMSVINFTLVILMVLVFLRVTRWREQTA